MFDKWWIELHVNFGSDYGKCKRYLQAATYCLLTTTWTRTTVLWHSIKHTHTFVAVRCVCVGFFASIFFRNLSLFASSFRIRFQQRDEKELPTSFSWFSCFSDSLIFPVQLASPDFDLRILCVLRERFNIEHTKILSISFAKVFFCWLICWWYTRTHDWFHRNSINSICESLFVVVVIIGLVFISFCGKHWGLEPHKTISAIQSPIICHIFINKTNIQSIIYQTIMNLMIVTLLMSLSSNWVFIGHFMKIFPEFPNNIGVVFGFDCWLERISQLNHCIFAQHTTRRICRVGHDNCLVCDNSVTNQYRTAECFGTAKIFSPRPICYAK